MSPDNVSPAPASRSGRSGPQAAIEFRHTTLLVTAALLVGVIAGVFVPPGPQTLVVATAIAIVVVLFVALFVGKRIRETMGAFRFTATLLVALAILAILGTLILQGKPPEIYRTRYHAVAPIILALRFDDIFHGLPFALLMALFCVAVSFSAALRWPIRRKSIGFYFVHLGLLLSLAGAAASSALSIRGRIDLLAGGDVATHVRVTRGGQPTGEVHPLGFDLKLDKFDLVNYESEYRIGFYQLVPSRDGQGEDWRLKTSFEPDVKPHLLPGGDSFQLKAIYPDFQQVATAVPEEGGAPAIQVTAGGRTTWLAPGAEPLLAPGDVAVVFDRDRPAPVDGVATSVLVGAADRKVIVHRADGESTLDLADGLAVLGGLVKFGPLLPSARLTLAPGTASQAWRNPAVQIEVRQSSGRQQALLLAARPQPVMLSRGGVPSGALVFEKRQDEVKSYLSTVTVTGPNETRHAVVSVNDPLAFSSWTLYQVNYDPKNPNYSGLEAVYDPGVKWVFAGFACISFGVFFVFYLKRFFLTDPRKKG